MSIISQKIAIFLSQKMCNVLKRVQNKFSEFCDFYILDMVDFVHKILIQLGFLLTIFKNANQWYPIANCIEGFKPKASGAWDEHKQTFLNLFFQNLFSNWFWWNIFQRFFSSIFRIFWNAFWSSREQIRREQNFSSKFGHFWWYCGQFSDNFEYKIDHIPKY